MAQRKFISYLRVSTERQGKSGLGLEAQEKAIEDFITGGDNKLLDTYVEIESGQNSARPELLKALEACKRTGAKLLIAKLDRLSRTVAFIANLMESNVEFVVCDFPEANEFTIHIFSAVAQHERRMISERTRAALQAAKARGVTLGNPQNLTKEAAERGRKIGVQSRKAKADNFSRERYPEIKNHIDQGLSLNAVAKKFNEEEVLTARGRTGAWTATAIRNIIKRVEML